MRRKAISRTACRIAIAVIIASTLTSGVGGAVPGDAAHSSDTERVAVCHVPSGNPSTAQLITVSEQGWEEGHSEHENDIRMDQHTQHHPDHQHDAETMCEHHGEHVA